MNGAPLACTATASRCTSAFTCRSSVRENSTYAARSPSGTTPIRRIARAIDSYAVMRPILSGKHNTSWMTRELSDGAGRSTIFWVLAAVCLSCQASPQEIPIVMHAGKTADGNKIAEYPSALDAILRVLVEWTAFHVTDALGIEDLGKARARMTAEVREVRRG